MNNFFKILCGKAKPAPSERLALGQMCGLLGIALNCVLFVIKLTAGLISRSVSVSADALNNLTDASASLVSLIGFKLSERKADKEHPFGHARAEYLSALGVSVIIILIGFELLRTSAGKIFHPSPVSFTPGVFVILAVSVAVKLFMFFYNRRIGRLIGSSTLKATACDSRNDCITTLGVLFGGVLSCAFSLNLDGFIGSLVAVFIIANGIGLINETVNPLLGSAPDGELVDKIQKLILSYPCVLGAHDLIIHDYGPGHRFASVHVDMPAEKNIIESHEIIDAMEKTFREEMNIELVVHLDPIVTSDGFLSSLRHKIEQIAYSIHPLCTIHDFSISGSLISFDCFKPPECTLSDETVKHIFTTETEKISPSYRVSVTVDRGFFTTE